MNFVTVRPIFPEAFFFSKPDLRCGAASLFLGTVRNHHEGRGVRSLYYECYASMANRRIREIREEVKRSKGLGELRILHRIGPLLPGEIALAVLAVSAHRAEAFAACEETVERIKQEVPIWKKEFYEDGTSVWVAGCAHARTGVS